jgi:hypothetical protein
VPALSGNGKPEVTDKYVTSYDGVAVVYIFLEALYFWVEDRACILKLLRKANKLYLCDLFGILFFWRPRNPEYSFVL